MRHIFHKTWSAIFFQATLASHISKPHTHIKGKKETTRKLRRGIIVWEHCRGPWPWQPAGDTTVSTLSQGPNCCDIDPALRALKCHIPPGKVRSTCYVQVKGESMECHSLWKTIGSTFFEMLWADVVVMIQSQSETYQKQQNNVRSLRTVFKFKEFLGQCQGCRCNRTYHGSSLANQLILIVF